MGGCVSRARVRAAALGRTLRVEGAKEAPVVATSRSKSKRGACREVRVRARACGAVVKGQRMRPTAHARSARTRVGVTISK